MLLLFLLAHHVLARDSRGNGPNSLKVSETTTKSPLPQYPRQTNYIIQELANCPPEGYFFKRESNEGKEGLCYLCFCTAQGAICWPRENQRCSVEGYRNYRISKGTKHRSRRSLDFSSVTNFAKNLFSSPRDTSAPCVPFKDSYSEGCPPDDWCQGCKVCDCSAKGVWDCHTLSFCPGDEKTTSKAPVTKYKKAFKKKFFRNHPKAKALRGKVDNNVSKSGKNRSKMGPKSTKVIQSVKKQTKKIQINQSRLNKRSMTVNDKLRAKKNKFSKKNKKLIKVSLKSLEVKKSKPVLKLAKKSIIKKKVPANKTTPGKKVSKKTKTTKTAVSKIMSSTVGSKRTTPIQKKQAVSTVEAKRTTTIQKKKPASSVETKRTTTIQKKKPASSVETKRTTLMQKKKPVKRSSENTTPGTTKAVVPKKVRWSKKRKFKTTTSKLTTSKLTTSRPTTSKPTITTTQFLQNPVLREAMQDELVLKFMPVISTIAGTDVPNTTQKAESPNTYSPLKRRDEVTARFKLAITKLMEKNFKAEKKKAVTKSMKLYRHALNAKHRRKREDVEVLSATYSYDDLFRDNEEYKRNMTTTTAAPNNSTNTYFDFGTSSIALMNITTDPTAGNLSEYNYYKYSLDNAITSSALNRENLTADRNTTKNDIPTHYTTADMVTCENNASFCTTDNKTITEIQMPPHTTNSPQITSIDNSFLGNDLKFNKWSESKALEDREQDLRIAFHKNITIVNDSKPIHELNYTPETRTRARSSKISRKVGSTGKKFKLKKLILTPYKRTHGRKNRPILATDVERHDLSKFVKSIITGFDKRNISKRQKTKRTKLIKYLQNIFKKMFTKNTVEIGSVKNQTKSINDVNKESMLETLCDSFGPCRINGINRQKLEPKIEDLRAQTTKMLKSIKIIKELLKSVDISKNDKDRNNKGKKHHSLKSDVQKLNVILRGTYSNELMFNKFTESDLSKIDYIKKNMQLFIKSTVKLAKVLNDIVDIITVNDNNEINEHENHKRLINSVNREKSEHSNIKSEFEKMKELLVKYNSIQNQFVKKMYETLAKVELPTTSATTKTTELKPKIQSKRTTEDYESQLSKYNDNFHKTINNSTTIKMYTKNIIKNLRKLKSFVETVSMNTRRKRELQDDDTMEYLLMLMEYVLKQNIPQHVAPANNGLDVLIDTIKQAPDIQHIKKKALYDRNMTATPATIYINKSKTDFKEFATLSSEEGISELNKISKEYNFTGRSASFVDSLDEESENEFRVALNRKSYNPEVTESYDNGKDPLDSSTYATIDNNANDLESVVASHAYSHEYNHNINDRIIDKTNLEKRSEKNIVEMNDNQYDQERNTNEKKYIPKIAKFVPQTEDRSDLIKANIINTDLEEANTNTNVEYPNNIRSSVETPTKVDDTEIPSVADEERARIIHTDSNSRFNFEKYKDKTENVDFTPPEKIDRFELFKNEIDSDTLILTTTTDSIATSDPSLTDFETSTKAEIVFADGKLDDKTHTDSRGNNKYLDWLDESLEEEIKTVSNVTNFSTRKKNKVVSSEFSSSLTKESAEGKKLRDSEDIMIKKEVNFLNSLDYDAMKYESEDSEYKDLSEDKFGSDAFK